MSRFAVLLVALLILGGAAIATESPASHSRAPAAGVPNFLFVLVDDQATNSFHRQFMPQTFRWIVDPGTRFTNALAAPPLCCPDRAGLLTGQYPHNNQVWSNHPGYPALADKSNTLPQWLRDAGYSTGVFGKYLNHYELVGGRQPAPGFDRWFELPGSSYYNYSVSDDGNLSHYGGDRSDYSTDVLTEQAEAFINQATAASRPFFAWLTYAAPHLVRVAPGPCVGSNPLPPDEAAYKRFADAKLPRPPSFNEANVSDKPHKVSGLPSLDASTIAEITQRWRCTLATMSEVDHELGQLMMQLNGEGVLRHTIVIYLSDNGFLFGEHRLPNGKGVSYEPSLRVPFAAYVPPMFRTGATSAVTRAVVTNQDIAPTLLDYVDRFGGSASPCYPPGDCRRLDGRSLVPLLGGDGWWRPHRGALVEIDSRRTPPATFAPSRRRVDPECDCAYEAIRTRRYVYVELSTGERELYDLARDPNELWNRVRSARYRAVRLRLASRLATLARCSGQRHRERSNERPFCE